MVVELSVLPIYLGKLVAHKLGKKDQGLLDP